MYTSLFKILINTSYLKILKTRHTKYLILNTCLTWCLLLICTKFFFRFTCTNSTYQHSNQSVYPFFECVCFWIRIWKRERDWRARFLGKKLLGFQLINSTNKIERGNWSIHNLGWREREWEWKSWNCKRRRRKCTFAVDIVGEQFINKQNLKF